MYSSVCKKLRSSTSRVVPTPHLNGGFGYDNLLDEYTLVEKSVFAAYHLLQFLYIRSNK